LHSMRYHTFSHSALTILICLHSTISWLSCDFLCLCRHSSAASFLWCTLASLARFILPFNNGHKLMIFTGLIMKNNMTFWIVTWKFNAK
jgi:hypothetical protein